MPALAGVLGHPVGHSRSPAMHNAAFDHLGLDWRYLALPVSPALFEGTVRALPGSGYRGANVTVPHKVAALELADRASPASRAIGAANTLTFGDDGTIEAENTDAGGFLDALGDSPRGRTALVLGAGGAARAVVWALRESGANRVAVWNRTSERARALSRELEVEHVASPESAEIVVNATSVGLRLEGARGEEISALGLDGLAAPAVVVDLVYASATTPVMAWGERRGARLVDGLDILVRQGARSFERWTGHSPPIEVMRAAARGG